MFALIDRNAERWALLSSQLLVVTMAVEVIRREAFSYSSIWGEEIVRYAFIYLAWIGAASAVRERAHIRIDVLFHYVGPKVKAILYIFGDLVMLAMAVIAVYWSWETVPSPEIRLGKPRPSGLDGVVSDGGAAGFALDLSSPPIPRRDVQDLMADAVNEGSQLSTEESGMLYQLQQQTVELGWYFYGPVLAFVFLVALGVPVWAAIGTAAVTMLLLSDVLPLSLVGESLFDGIDHFALTAIPLFILTGDVLVRTGLSRKFLDVAEALTCWAKGGFGSATVLVCGMFSAISGSDAAGAAAAYRMTINRLVESGYPRPYACALLRPVRVPAF